MNIKTMFTVLAATAALAAPAFSSDGSSAGTASYGLRLEGFVPVICRVSVQATAAPTQDGLTDLGRMTEFCNAAAGYQVWVDHAPGLDGALLVDGERIALSDTGSTLVSASRTAAFRSHALAADLGGQTAALSLRIAPA